MSANEKHPKHETAAYLLSRRMHDEDDHVRGRTYIEDRAINFCSPASSTILADQLRAEEKRKERVRW